MHAKVRKIIGEGTQKAKTDIIQTDLKEVNVVQNSAPIRPPPKTPRNPSDHLNPNRFYDDDYIFVMKRLAIEDIDKLGPITFKNICERIDRNEGLRELGQKFGSGFRLSLLASENLKKTRLARIFSGQRK